MGYSGPLCHHSLVRASSFFRHCPEPPYVGSYKVMNDLKFAFRQLLKNPGFTAVAVLTLALGIGANTAIFSVIYGVLLKPLPYRDPEQLIRVFESSASQPKFPMSAGDFQDYREQNSTLAGLALYTRQDLHLSKHHHPDLLSTPP